MEIRKLDVADVYALREFAERTFRIAYEHMNEPLRFNRYCAQAFSIPQLEKELLHPASGFWVLMEQGQWLAYIKLNTDHHPPELATQSSTQIERIYVEPDKQGQGLGEKMLDFALQQAVAAGSEWIWLSVWEQNPRAVRFYERCGYRICGEEIFWVDDDPQKDWVMARKIDE